MTKPNNVNANKRRPAGYYRNGYRNGKRSMHGGRLSRTGPFPTGNDSPPDRTQSEFEAESTGPRVQVKWIERRRWLPRLSLKGQIFIATDEAKLARKRSLIRGLEEFATRELIANLDRILEGAAKFPTLLIGNGRFETLDPSATIVAAKPHHISELVNRGLVEIVEDRPVIADTGLGLIKEPERKKNGHS